MHFKAENLTIPKHPRLLFLAQNLGVLRPSKTWGHFFWDTLYLCNKLWREGYSIPLAKFSSSSLVTSGIVLFLSHLHSILETLVLVLITFEYKLRKVMVMNISVMICHRASLRHDTDMTTFRVSWHVTQLVTCCHISLSTYFKKLTQQANICPVETLVCVWPNK